MLNIKNKKLITSFIAMITLLVVFTGDAYADCIQFYGGGEVCGYTNRFRIEKKVRVVNENQNWEDKVLNVSQNDFVEFEVTVENRSDDEADGPENFDDFNYEDFLPDEMEWVSGHGLTEYWDGFQPGEEFSFVIVAKLKNSEFDNQVKFEKCIVNKVELYWNGDFEDSDIATVCYGDGEGQVLGLPSTGPTEAVALLGTLMLVAGVTLKRKTSLVQK